MTIETWEKLAERCALPAQGTPRACDGQPAHALVRRPRERPEALQDNRPRRRGLVPGAREPEQDEAEEVEETVEELPF